MRQVILILCIVLFWIMGSVATAGDCCPNGAPCMVPEISVTISNVPQEAAKVIISDVPQQQKVSDREEGTTRIAGAPLRLVSKILGARPLRSSVKVVAKIRPGRSVVKVLRKTRSRRCCD